MFQREDSWAAKIGHLPASLPLLPFLDMIKLKLQAGVSLQVINPRLICTSTNIQNQFHGGE